MNSSSPRNGSVYIAVLGTALIVSIMALSALALGRLQMRQQMAYAEMRQAQLNAAAAVQLGLVTLENTEDWRSTASAGTWISGQNTGRGSCNLEVSDPIDGNLGDDPDDPLLLLGIGTVGQTQQRLAVTVYPERDPLSCLRSAVAVGDQISLFNDTLRVTGLISANQVTASVSSVYGEVEAVTASGATYYGTKTLIAAKNRPDMPDWQTVFDYYRNNGTEIDINNLPATPPNLIRNSTFETGISNWSDDPPGMGSCRINQSNNRVHSGNYSLQVDSFTGVAASGAAQYIDHFVEPGEQYYAEAWVYLDSSIGGVLWMTMHTKGTGGTVQYTSTGYVNVASRIWTKLSATFTAPAWSGDLEYAYVSIGTPLALTINRIYVDDVVVRKAAAGRYIYKQLLSPTYNPFGTGQTNAEGIYWIDCANNKLIIERSRIHGTLLVVNPGTGSEIGTGPIHWSPAKPGYPALLVDADNAEDADFAFRANNRVLSEKDNDTNFNPTGSPHDEFGDDVDQVDNYASEINGLVAVEDTVNYSNRTLIRGQLIVGDDINNSSGTLEVEFQPDSLLCPPPGFQTPYLYKVRPGAVVKDVLP
jgi:Carbohydrate binding domain